MSPFRRHKRGGPAGPRLFPEAARPADAWVASVDGASRGNPGPASYAVVVRRPGGGVVFQMKKYLGVATNNVAEYYALLTALDYAVTHGVPRLRVLSDSELLVRQMHGHYKVRSASLRPLHEQARKLAAALAWFSIEHVPREMNREADRLANQALDETAGRGAEGETRKSKQETPGAESGKGASKAGARTVRARYVNGALHPAAPLALEEGEEVELTIRRPAS